MGRRLGGARPGRHDARGAGACPRRVPPGSREPAPRAAISRADEQRALLLRVGVDDGAAPDGEPATAVAPIAGGAPRAADRRGGAGETVIAVVPTWRRDIAIEADVTEEVARVRGYETIPAILPHTPMPAWRPSPLAIRDRIRETLAGAGLTEVVSHALVSPRLAERFAWASEIAPVAGGEPRRRPPDPRHEPAVGGPLGAPPALVGQPRRDRLDEPPPRPGRRRDLRDRQGLRRRRRAHPRVVAARRWRSTGAVEEPAWNRPRRVADLDDAKGVIELVCRRLGFAAPTWSRRSPASRSSIPAARRA